MPAYQLINPSIEGTFESVVDAKQPIKAAEKIWVNLAEHIADHVPNFMFTIKNLSGGSYFHFKVNENKEESSYSISPIEKIENDKEHIEGFLKNVDQYNEKLQQKANTKNESKKSKQSGGKKPKRRRYDDDDDSSSSSSDYIPTIRRTSPVSVFHYTSSLYTPVIGPQVIGVRTTLNPTVSIVRTPIFAPVFRTTLNPMITLWP